MNYKISIMVALILYSINFIIAFAVSWTVVTWVLFIWASFTLFSLSLSFLDTFVYFEQHQLCTWLVLFVLTQCLKKRKEKKERKKVGKKEQKRESCRLNDSFFFFIFFLNWQQQLCPQSTRFSLASEKRRKTNDSALFTLTACDIFFFFSFLFLSF